MTIAGKTFAAGIQMESLSAQSCNALWNPCFISCSTGTESYKLMEMSGFAIYWDSIQTDSLWGDLPSQELSVSYFFMLKNSDHISISDISMF